MYQPFNAVTGKPYEGKNVLILSEAAIKLETTDARWMTYLQAKSQGWQVRKGSKGTTIKVVRELPQDGDAKTIVRRYKVFNATQVEGIS